MGAFFLLFVKRMNNNNNNNKSPFDILGVNRFSTQKEIRRRYLDLCKKHHPDVSTNKTIDFREITVAYELLTNSKKNNNTTGVNWEQVQKTSINTRTWTLVKLHLRHCYHMKEPGLILLLKKKKNDNKKGIIMILLLPRGNPLV
ncbi:hypothetical protein BDF21DRAFT_415187 [Thamnidium elegans]|nr:hypothetical protein BDF21DRAFT_415187 [Thamnidium elegans]